MVITVGSDEGVLVAAWLLGFVLLAAALRLPRITAMARSPARGVGRRLPLPFTGRVFVIDGDTVHVRRSRVRLHGIDAPELTQLGGWKARSHMIGIAGGREVAVEPVDIDRYGRIVARVRLGRADLSERMVRDGFARATTDWCLDYAAAEFEARRQPAGPLGDDGHRRSGRAPPPEGRRRAATARFRSGLAEHPARVEAVREEHRGAVVGGGERLVARVGRRHRDQVEPGPLDGEPQDARHPRRVAARAGLRDQRGADLLELADVGTVVGAAGLLVDRPALRLAPEGAPGLEPRRRADRRRVVGADQRVEPLGRRRPRRRQRPRPVLPVLLGQVEQRLRQQPVLAAGSGS